MSAKKPCRHENCEEMPPRGAIFCVEHLSTPHRCKKTRNVEGRTQRCKKTAMHGLEYCDRHGGLLPSNKAISERTKPLTAMQRFVRPYEGRLDLMDAFEAEYRRTLGRIAWYDEQLAGLKRKKDLVWGVTKYESAGGFEGAPNRTYEARVNILEEMQRWERKHLLDLTKVGLAAGIEQQRLDMLGTYISQVQGMMQRVLEHVGLDMADPKVKEAIAILSAEDERALPQIDLHQIGPDEYA